MEPGTAAHHAMFAIAVCDPCRAILRRLIIINSAISGVEAILGILEHVADHVIKTELVGSKGAHRRGLLVVPLTATTLTIGHRLPVELDFVSPRINCRRSSARRIFVFGLGKQPISLTGGPR